MFTAKFYLARRRIEQRIYNSPSIVFLGAGEKAITHVSGHASKHDDVHYAHHPKGILAAPHHSRVRGMNAKKIVYVFDADKKIGRQVKSYKSHGRNFGKITAAAFGGRNMKSLRSEIGRVHDLSSESGTDKLKDLIDSALSS